MQKRVVKKKEVEKGDKKKKFDKEIIDLVMARLRTIPPNASLSVGGDNQDLTASEMMRHVEEEDHLGELIIETHLEHLRSLKDLPLPTEENEVSNY